jgi:hypothetical protein
MMILNRFCDARYGNDLSVGETSCLSVVYPYGSLEPSYTLGKVTSLLAHRPQYADIPALGDDQDSKYRWRWSGAFALNLAITFLS